jgi:GT2 family glycosyltransferase
LINSKVQSNPEKAIVQQPAGDIPLVSIIIVNYNSQDDLSRCLDSLTSTAETEVIVVDNASTDGSADYIELEYPDVHIVRSENNLGFGDGNNLGARIAHGRYLAFLNPDTLVEGGWLEALIQELENHPDAGMVTSQILQMDQPDRISACGNDIHISGLTLGRGMGQKRDSYKQVEEVTAISGASFCIRGDIFTQIGGFDQDFFLYMEDTDLSLRMRLFGRKCLYIPQSVVYHDYKLNISPRKTFYQERNRYLMLIKCYHWMTLFILLPVLLLAEVVTWGFVLLRDRKNAGNKFQAYLWILKNWKEINRKRVQTQQLRQVKDRDLLKNSISRLAYEQTGGGAIIWLAHIVFDSLFYIFKQFSLLLIWW